MLGRSSKQGIKVRHFVVFVAVCFLALVLIIPCTSAANPAPNVRWSKTFGGENFEEAFSIIQTSDGGYALAGSTDSYGAGHGDFWLVKIDSSSNEEWSKTFGGSDGEEANSIIQTSDGGYALAGWTSSYNFVDFWIVKTDSLGNEEWSKTFGGENWDKANSIIQTSDGGYAVAGHTWNGEGGDFWLLKLDFSGNIEWNKAYGGTDFEAARSVIQTSDGGYAIAGYTGSYGAGRWDFWLVKTDSSGIMEWSKTFGGTWLDGASSIIQTSDGGYALAGKTVSYGAGSYDFWLVKTDSSGNMQWNKTFGSENWDEANSIIQTSDGGYAIAGWTDSYGAGESDFWLVKTDSSGNMEWSENFGGENDDVANSAIQTSDGGYVLAGYTDSYGAGKHDFWLVKLQGPESKEVLIYVAVGTIVVVIVALAVILYERRRG